MTYRVLSKKVQKMEIKRNKIDDKILIKFVRVNALKIISRL